MWGCVWQPLTLDRWQNGDKAGNYGIMQAYEMSRRAVREHSRSHVWAAIAGYSYIPTAEEMSLWDRAEAEKRTGKPRGWRPWKQKAADPFYIPSAQSEQRRDKEREELNRFYHIHE